MKQAHFSSSLKMCNNANRNKKNKQYKHDQRNELSNEIRLLKSNIISYKNYKNASSKNKKAKKLSQKCLKLLKEKQQDWKIAISQAVTMKTKVIASTIVVS